MGVSRSFLGMLRFRYKLYLSEIKSRIRGGSFIYKLTDKVNFVCSHKDYFSQIIFISNGHEKFELKWCEAWLKNWKNNSWVVDCGANIGYFSCYLAQTNPDCSFSAIEGNASTFLLLEKNSKLLKLNQVKPVNAILAESLDKNYSIPDNPGREPWQQAISSSVTTVTTLTLDLLTEKHIPELVKIDCEGFEVKVLKGASRLLSLASSAFMVECNDAALKEAGTDRIELFELFRNNQYKLFHLASFDRDIPAGTVITNDFLSREFNFVAIPDKQEYLRHWEDVLNQLNKSAA